MNEHLLIEQYVSGNMSSDERVVFEARLLIETGLAEKTALQQEVYNAVIRNGRKQLRQEIAEIDRRLFTEKRFARFREKIYRIFH